MFIRDVYFNGWQEFVPSDISPEGWERADDYMEGNVRIVIWHVFEQLIESGIFSQLYLSSPFRLGYQFHEEELIVLSILNWPPISTSKDDKKSFEQRCSSSQHRRWRTMSAFPRCE